MLEVVMITDGIENPVTKAAILALQQADKNAWRSLFDAHAQLFDDAQPRSLKGVKEEALGHEQFRSIDGVEDGGVCIEGEFHSDTGGVRDVLQIHFKSVWKDHRLDIGQAA